MFIISITSPDADTTHSAVGPFKTQQEAINNFKEYIKKDKEGGEEAMFDWENIEDFLDDTTPFVRVQDSYQGQNHEFHIIEMGKTFEDLTGQD